MTTTNEENFTIQYVRNVKGHFSETDTHETFVIEASGIRPRFECTREKTKEWCANRCYDVVDAKYSAWANKILRDAETDFNEGDDTDGR